MAELSRPVQSFDPRNAEIVADETPKWYLLEVHEPAQRNVETELDKRRFGVFVPQERVTVVERGRKFERIRLLFPGYIFVFVWDIERHWSEDHRNLWCLAGSPFPSLVRPSLVTRFGFQTVNARSSLKTK